MASINIFFKVISLITKNKNIFLKKKKTEFSFKQKNNSNKTEKRNSLTSKIILTKANYIIINLFIIILFIIIPKIKGYEYLLLNDSYITFKT